MDFAIIQLVNYLRISHLQKNFHTLDVSDFLLLPQHLFDGYDIIYDEFYWLEYDKYDNLIRFFTEKNGWKNY